MLALASLSCGAAAAEVPGERLEEVERDLQAQQDRGRGLGLEAEALRREIASLRRESVEVARRTQDLEARASALEDSIERLQAEQATKTTELKERRVQLTHTLAALQRLAVQPAVALLAGPGAPIDRARSALLLEVAIPAIEGRAEGLRRDLEALAAIGSDVAGRREELAATAVELESKRSRLAALIGQREALRAKTVGERDRARERAGQLAATARDLRELIAGLEEEARQRAARETAEREARETAEREARGAARRHAEREALEAARRRAEEETGGEVAQGAVQGAGETQQALLEAPAVLPERPANLRSFPERPGHAALTMPVRGDLVTLYGQNLDSSVETAKGLTIATRPAAQVVAPYDGQVLYAGVFRGYGQILIMEHGGRYHTLLAGLETIQAVVGQWFLAGEPIGIMGSPQGGNPELYLELRRTGQPINPLPWLATTENKVQG